METLKVVVRYADGRIVKGLTQNFFPNKDRFHIRSAAGTSGEPTEIIIKDLKAIFFVRDFEGNAEYNERKEYAPGEKVHGKIVVITFRDGEVIVGTTLGYNPNRQGFFVFPADQSSNNMRAFAVMAAVRSVRYV